MKGNNVSLTCLTTMILTISFLHYLSSANTRKQCSCCRGLGHILRNYVTRDNGSTCLLLRACPLLVVNSNLLDRELDWPWLYEDLVNLAIIKHVNFKFVTCLGYCLQRPEESSKMHDCSYLFLSEIHSGLFQKSCQVSSKARTKKANVQL